MSEIMKKIAEKEMQKNPPKNRKEQRGTEAIVKG